MPTESMSTESATLDAVTGPSRAHRARRRPRYLELWRGVPRELGFLLPTLPIIVVCFAVLNAVFWAGVGTVVIYVGVFLVLAALYVARGFGTLELVRLRWAGRGEVRRPSWRTATTGGALRRIFGPYANGHYWLYLLHGYVVNFAVGIATWVVTIVWVSTGLGGVTNWFWGGFIPRNDDDFTLSHTMFGFFFPGVPIGFDGRLGDALLQLVAGLLFLATLPFVTRGLTLLHAVIARGLLGAWRSERLEREVAELSESRESAIVAEDRSLRRLERDLHDGPQQRLLRLQLDLASAERAIADDPDAARRLLGEARSQAGETLEELRALSRGFAPPLLQDRGLAAALESLASRSPIPARFTDSLPAGTVVPPQLERAAYFVAAELMANAARHSGGSHVLVRLAVEPGERGGLLVVAVEDDGRGGAAEVSGHGIEGLQGRLRGLGGVLVVTSPVGGPTTAVARIPLGDPKPDPQA